VLEPRVQSAIDLAFGDESVEIEAVIGGASGASTYRVAASKGPYLLRVEGNRAPGRNPHQYAAMQAAADAGIAPPIRYLDDTAGVVVMQMLRTQPLESYPGGPVDLARDAAALLTRVHVISPAFATHRDYLASIGSLFDLVIGAGRVAPGLLDEHRAGFDSLVTRYPWDPSTHVSCHNDPNQQNLLFDGTRLWLIDWETAYRNDPFVDIAQFIRVFSGLILLLIAPDPATPTQNSLEALSVDDFTAAVASGELVPSQPNTAIAFAKLMLERFRVECQSA